MKRRLFLAVKGKSLLIFFGLLFLAFLGSSYLGLFAGEKVIPEQLFSEAIKNTQASKAFRYQVEIKTERQGILSQVEGAWVSPNLVHLKGKMYNTPVEFIHPGETTYLKDIWTKKWLALEGNRLGPAQLYIMELEPFSFLTILNMFEIRYRGLEKTKEGKMLLLEGRFQLPASRFNEQKEEYQGRFWIGKNDRRIRQVLLQPVKTEEKNLPVISLRFWDYDQAITIKPPEKVEAGKS